MILDTTFLIDLFDGHDGAFSTGVDLSSDGTIQRVPTPVLTELSYGVAFGDDAERRNVRNALQMYPTVELSETLARRAGTLLAAADRTAGGESGVRVVDSMVAAVADSHGEPVLTANARDFELLGVAVERYR